MAEKGGYWGRILNVDLSRGTTTIRNFDEGFARKYLGGVGLATRIIYDGVTPETNPLEPGNILVFATGPYQATNIPGAGKCSVASKSPLTGFWGESSGGANIGPEIKRAGFDAVAITGRAEKPVYLWINDGQAEIRDGTKFWGQDTARVVDALQEEVGDTKAAIASIGQAGENENAQVGRFQQPTQLKHEITQPNVLACQRDIATGHNRSVDQDRVSQIGCRRQPLPGQADRSRSPAQEH